MTEYRKVKRYKQNPRLNIRETKVIDNDEILYEAVAEVILRIDGVQYDKQGNIRLPIEWSPENITTAITDVLAQHGTTVFAGFRKGKRGHHHK